MFPDFSQTIFSKFSIVNPSRFVEGELVMINGFLSNVHIAKYSGIELRNYGPFSEPGKFQFYIILAFIFEVFFIDRKKKYIRPFVYFITCLSTFSTTGIFLIFILLFMHLWKCKNDKRMWFTLLSLFAATCLLLFVSNIDFSLLFDNAISKFTNGGDSFNSRYGSLIGNFYSFLEKPLFGWGYDGFLNNGAYFLNYTIDNTNTILSIFAIYGLSAGSIFLLLIFKFVGTLKINFMEKIIVFLVVFISTSNEYFVDSAILYLLFFSFVDFSLTAYKKGEFFAGNSSLERNATAA